MFAFSHALRAVVIAPFIALSLTSAMAADATPGLSPDDWLRTRVLPQGRDQPVSSLFDIVRNFYSASDIDGGGISASDHELADRLDDAQLRAMRVGQLLQHDLDGDGKVTRAELETVFTQRASQPLYANGVRLLPTREQIAQQKERLIAEALRADADGDGVLTIAEVSREPQGAERSGLRNRRLKMVPLSFDSDGDGSVSPAEFEARIDTFLKTIDTDGNGKVSDAESAAFAKAQEAARRAESAQRQAERQEEEMRKKVATCRLPQPSPDSRIILVGAYEGAAISSVSLGGDDKEVRTAQVEIEPGTERLYIVATTYRPMVWLVSGATERVEMFAATSFEPGPGKPPSVGVTGLAKDRVYVPSVTGCVRHFHQPKASEGVIAAGEAKALLGRPVNDTVGMYTLSKAALPSGILASSGHYPKELAPPFSRHAAALRDQAPVVAEIDPASVTSALPVKTYAVLPHAAGLAQLVDEGALEVLAERKVYQLGRDTVYEAPDRARPTVSDDPPSQVGSPPAKHPSLRQMAPSYTLRTFSGGRPSKVVSVPSEFRIVRQIRLPAGLRGATSFVLAKGVPMPDGDPGGVRIVSEETGLIVMGPELRR